MTYIMIIIAGFASAYIYTDIFLIKVYPFLDYAQNVGVTSTSVLSGINNAQVEKAELLTYMLFVAVGFLGMAYGLHKLTQLNQAIKNSKDNAHKINSEYNDEDEAAEDVDKNIEQNTKTLKAYTAWFMILLYFIPTICVNYNFSLFYGIASIVGFLGFVFFINKIIEQTKIVHKLKSKTSAHDINDYDIESDYKKQLNATNNKFLLLTPYILFGILVFLYIIPEFYIKTHGSIKSKSYTSTRKRPFPPIKTNYDRNKKKCYSNIRTIQSAIESYNREHTTKIKDLNEKAFAELLNGYLINIPKCPESSLNKYAGSNLDKGGQVRCSDSATPYETNKNYGNSSHRSHGCLIGK